jgi:hypothetical protein
MAIEQPKIKKYISLILPYQKNDEKLQKEQNDLIHRNTKITIIIGAIAILAQIAEVIVSLLT